MGKGKKYKPSFTKDQARALCAECMGASSLAECADILDRTADEVLADITARNVRTVKTGSLAGMEWVDNMRLLASALREGRAAYAIFAKGNSKLPFYSYSELPEFTCPGAGACLSFCYSFTAWRYPGALMRQLQNTLLMRFKRSLIARAFMTIPLAAGAETVTLRLYVDGDFRDMTVLAFWFKMLNDRPEVACYGYSKSWELFDNWDRQGLAFPANYVLNMSSGSKYADNADLRDRMKHLPVTRGEFVAVPVDGKYDKGFARFDDRAYHAAVRTAGRASTGSRNVYSCTGRCGECLPSGAHACGQRDFVATIVIAFHN